MKKRDRIKHYINALRVTLSCLGEAKSMSGTNLLLSDFAKANRSLTDVLVYSHREIINPALMPTITRNIFGETPPASL